MTPEEADKAHQWAGMDGAIAWHLIDRHADNWNEVGEMLNAWLRANTPDLSPVIAWLENGCAPAEAAKELRIYQQRMRSNAKVSRSAPLLAQVGSTDGLGAECPREDRNA